MKRPSLLLLGFGLVCLAISGTHLYKRLNPQQLAFTHLPRQEVSQIKNAVPSKIEIPSLKLSLPIFPAEIINNEWVTTDKGVSYVMSSPLPGEKGNSILYGHNFSNILGKLPNIKPGETITITFTNGIKQTFVTDKTAVVTPSDSSVLATTDEPAITIYTCTGFLDSKRFVVKALQTS